MNDEKKATIWVVASIICFAVFVRLVLTGGVTPPPIFATVAMAGAYFALRQARILLRRKEHKEAQGFLEEIGTGLYKGPKETDSVEREVAVEEFFKAAQAGFRDDQRRDRR